MARVTGVGGLETESDTRWRRGCSLHCLDSLAFPPHLLIISPPPPQLQPGKTEIWKKTVRRRKFILSSPSIVLPNATWQFRAMGGLCAQFGEDANRLGGSIMISNCSCRVMLMYNWSSQFSVLPNKFCPL